MATTLALPSWPKRCCPRSHRLQWGLLAGLVVVALGSFVASGVHEEFLSLLLATGGGRRAVSAPLLPSAEAFLLVPSAEACAPRAPFLLVLVASAPSHAPRRQAVRNTWGGARWAAGHPVRTFFAVGLPPEPSQQAALEREAAQHGDVVQGRFLDTYGNLTLKTLALLGWAATRCLGAAFVIKADDDIFLNLPALAAHLAELPSPPRPTYLGRIHWQVRPNRDPRSRHHVPASLYPDSVFPPYCSGTAYVLSGDAVPALLGAARHVPLVPVEDVFVGLCARRAGIAPRHVAHMAGSAHFPADPCCYREVLFSVHDVAPSKMTDMWNEAGTHEQSCSSWQRTLGLLRCKALAWLTAL
ncbi:beta-1,3-galactosyltransferase 4 [Rhineura floridana]|uniref:beta-1,3-galactosyltransferase 4 n=1 Tax=Rhineura floridana TaxID=261503 RepID=UPI002AC86C12|nr:beta-1,3-galactosyltransferase 4 [Rhineura floridana]